jgi:hypothetical protein
MPKMLPALPVAFGNLKDVFRSASDSLAGKTNPFGLPKVKNSLVIMVDGLGLQNLRKYPGHSTFLQKHINKTSKAYSAFPSTTAASIVSLATGVSPSEHGFIGYKIYNRESTTSVNLLTGVDSKDFQRYLRVRRISETTDVIVVSRPEYQNSGFSSATFGAAKFVSAENMESRFDLALGELNTGSGKLIYLYIPELDQAAHRYGCNSRNWIELLELLDSLTKKLVSTANVNTGVLLTADHGVIDVPLENHIYLDECPVLADVVDVGGDPRASFIYFETGIDLDSRIGELNGWLAGQAEAFSIEDLVANGVYSADVLQHKSVLPDCVVLAGTNSVCYHRSFAKPTSLKMIGQHGGLSEAEITVPLLRFVSYSSSLLVP